MPLPKSKELKVFAKGFDEEEWVVLCQNQEFLNSFTENLEKTRILAEKILDKKCNVKT